MVPTVVLPPVTPLTAQVTASLLVPVTVATKICRPAPARTLAVAGVTVTTTLVVELVSVRFVEPDSVGSVVETAVIVTVGDEGMTAGDWYWPAAEIVPTVELPPVIPLTCQLTLSPVELVMLAVYETVWPPMAAVALTGETEMVAVTSVGPCTVGEDELQAATSASTKADATSRTLRTARCTLTDMESLEFIISTPPAAPLSLRFNERPEVLRPRLTAGLPLSPRATFN
jgi:hypothetical protein